MEERALVGNASDVEQVRAAERAEKRVVVSNEGARDAVMKTPEGRQFMWWLLEKCGVFQSVMRGGPEMIRFYAGQQDLGHELMAELRKEPEFYLKMQSEATERAKYLKPSKKEAADARSEA